jgi:glycosyltransferase involved in cell wall biosynthesis
VHPSLSEAQSQVIIEALALSRPVIASDVGAASDAVIPNQTGWLVPARDERALARALTDAASDRARLRAFGDAGRRLVHATYSIEQMASGYRAIYEEAVG